MVGAFQWARNQSGERSSREQPEQLLGILVIRNDRQQLFDPTGRTFALI
jgi:hypothetical protein